MLTRRIKLSGDGAVYHCIARIVGGAMLLGDKEKEHLRRLMWRLAEFSGIEIVTYCLMTNHIHLLVRVRDVASLTDDELTQRTLKYYGRNESWVQVVAEEFKRTGSLPAIIRKSLLAKMGDVSVFMRTLKQRFSRWYNRKHKRFGTLWAERFKSVLVQDASEAMRTIAMYIDLNPVRAGMVNDPKDYRFCGHAEAVAGNAAARSEIVPLCESNSWRKACGEYRASMMAYAENPGREDRAVPDRETILSVLRHGGTVELSKVLRLRIRYLTDGVIFGSREFVENTFQEFRDRFGAKRSTGARRLNLVQNSLGDLATARALQNQAVG